MTDTLSTSTKGLLQNSTEVIKNRVFGMPLTQMTRHQRVSFTAMIKIAYEQLDEDSEVVTFTYPTDDFFKLIGIKDERKKSHLFSDEDDWGREKDEYSLENTLKKLVEKSINLRHKDPVTKEYVVEGVTLVSYFKLTKEKITFRFDEWIKEKIPSVSNVYIMKMPTIASLKSGHTVTMFEQIEQRRDFKRWNVAVADLRLIFGVEEHKYKKFSDFRKYVLEKSKDEINEKTNYTLAYQLIKTGRSITKIIFSWHIAKDDDPYTQWKSFIRTTFIEIPLLKSKVGGSAELHLIKVSRKGLLYNQYNSDYVYSSEEAKVIWKYMFDNQELLLIKNKTEHDDASMDPDSIKDYSAFIGKDYIFDNDLYPNIILITPVKNKLKVKFYDGNTFILTEAELTEGVKF